MKRKIKKKNEILLNKLTSTNDKTTDNKTSIKLLQKKVPINQTNNTKHNNNYISINYFITSLENKIKRTYSEENLLKLFKETENLNNIITIKMDELENNKKKCMEELLLINNNIKIKLSELEVSTNKSKKILNKLNQLNLKINEEYKKAKVDEVINKFKNDKMNNKNQNNTKIKNGNKLILLNNNIIDKFKIYKEKLEKIYISDKNGKINNLKEELEKLKNDEKELKTEIGKMRLIKETHEKKCNNMIKELENNLERAKNEFNIEYKIKEINNVSTVKKQHSLKNKSVNSLPNIYNNIIIPPNEKENENGKTIQQSVDNKIKLIKNEKLIIKDFEEIQEHIIYKFQNKRRQNIKTYINSRNEKVKEIKNNNLFSPDEQNILKDIIPMECLNIYQNKYKTITDEKNKIIQILKKNEEQKKLNQEKNQIIFLNDKKEHNIEMKNIELNSKIVLINKNIAKINKEISEMQKELYKINRSYKIKKKENEKLKDKWISFNKDIKQKKIVVKKGETLSEIELSYINQFGKLKDIDFITSSEKADKNESDIFEINTT